MSIKELFTEEEWAGILQAPMLAGFGVTAADPSGLWGAVKESAATAGSLSSAMRTAPEGSLASEVVEAFKTSEGRDIARDGVRGLVKGKKAAEAAEAAVAQLGTVAAVVQAKAPEQAADFKAWLKDTAQKVAEAGTEGGFLGFGGEKVSEKERKTLADIDAALA